MSSINITINAIDAKSFKEYIERNPEVLLEPLKKQQKTREEIIDEYIMESILRNIKNNKYRTKFKSLLL